MYDIFLLIVLLAVFAALVRDGLWSNTLTLFNVLLSGLLATSYFEPVATFLTGNVYGGMVHYWDLIAFTSLFAASTALLRMLSKGASGYRLRFHPVVDNFGGMAMGLWAGWITVCVVCFARHLAPLSKTYMNDTFKPETKLFFGAAPDRVWVGFVQQLSEGALGTGDADRVFDPRGELLLKYAGRREYLGEQINMFE